MKVLFVASEAVPFIKSGGLGDVVGSLPKALQKRGIDIRIILPKYGDIPEEYKKKIKHLINFSVSVGWRQQYCGVGEMEYNKIKFYFIDNEYYFKRPGLYGYYDEAERFAFFSRAVLEALEHMDFLPDIIHCHDWQTSLIPFLLKEQYRHSKLKNIKTVMTIHNLKYQGRYGKKILEEVVGVKKEYGNKKALEFYNDVNFLKSSIYYSDIVTTVSPTYAEEIKNPFYGEKLDGILCENKHKLRGVLNGLDYEIFNPQKDPHIFQNYTTSLKKKEVNKNKLQELTDLPRKDVPILAIISRLVEQKGLDLLAHVIYEILNLDIQIIVLGTGEKKYENMFKRLEEEFPNKVKSYIQFDVDLAQKIYSGSDILIIPSLFEPCGLTQMIALKYGTIPIVRETGGLKDTIIPYDKYTHKGNGFSFKNYNAYELLNTIQKAIELFDDKIEWPKLMKNAFRSKYSWDKSAKEYEEIYEYLG